jgi:dolichyl-phosphate-mannose--protein O-mannosyl transferase
MFRKIRKRGFMLGESLGWWILAIAVGVAVLIFIFLLKGKGVSLLETFKDLVRFGR